MTEHTMGKKKATEQVLVYSHLINGHSPFSLSITSALILLSHLSLPPATSWISPFRSLPCNLSPSASPSDEARGRQLWRRYLSHHTFPGKAVVFLSLCLKLPVMIKQERNSEFSCFLFLYRQYAPFCPAPG